MRTFQKLDPPAVRGGRRMQAAAERLRDEWRELPPVAQLLAAFERYATGAEFGEAGILAATLASVDRAGAILSPLVERLCSALREHPLVHVPFRHQFARGVSVLELFRSRQATLSLVTYEGAAVESTGAARVVAFADEERHELCLAGAASGRIVTLRREHADRAELNCRPRSIVRGTRLVLGPSEAKLIEQVEGRQVLLRLARPSPHPAPTREFALDDGRLIHRAAGDPRESREEMALALLGRMKRIDAAETMAAVARRPGSDHLRWQALRNALALDPVAGFSALEEIARETTDTLCAPAASLRQDLVRAHPALAKVGAMPCRA